MENEKILEKMRNFSIFHIFHMENRGSKKKKRSFSRRAGGVLPLATANGDAMAGVINKVWSYFVCFGARRKPMISMRSG